MDKTTELITSSLVLPLIKSLVENKVKTLFDKNKSINIRAEILEANFEEYLIQRYDKFIIIDTLAFPNKQTLFDTLYEPLTVMTEEVNRKKVNILIDDYPSDFIPKYIRVLIEDTAGMGKSTIVKKLFKSAIEKKIGIPILIELRQINKNNTILKEIQNQLTPLGKKISQDLILKILAEGGFIFLFDGFDEVSNDDRNFVNKDLHIFIEKASQNYFLITSRPENSLASFGDFQKFIIEPLSKESAYRLIQRYDIYSFISVQKKLIKALEENKESSIKEFLKSPLLVSLLYKSFDFKKDIPIKKNQFYRQVYDAFFEAHDLSKEGYFKREKYSKLHSDDFDKMLRYVGYLTSIKNKVEYEMNFIIGIIDNVKTHLPSLSFNSGDFIKDLLETVPLFKKEGNYIKWAHKSFQDYFAAKFIWIDSKENQEEILKKIYKDSDNKRFYNLLDLFYEMDPKTFETTILYWLLSDFKKFSSDNINKLNTIPIQLRKQRIENLFHKKCVIVVTNQADYESIKSGITRNRISINQFLSESEKDQYEYTSTIYNYFTEPKVVVLTDIMRLKNTANLLKLICSFDPDLVSFKNHKVNLKELGLLEENMVYAVDDSENNIVNNEKSFALINDLTLFNYTISFDTALLRLENIEKQKSLKNSNDFLNW